MDTGTPAAPPTSLGDLIKRSPASVALIVANVVLFAIAEAHGSTRETETLLRYGAVWRGSVWSGEWWRLATAMFLHVGITHLVWNAWFGFRMCTELERDLGSVKFLALYVGAGVAGSALSVMGHDVVAAGASGALFGLIGARFLRWRLALGSWRAVWKEPRLQRDVMMTGLWFVIGTFAGFDNWAHLGGMVFGLTCMWAIMVWPRRVPLVLTCALLVGLVAAAQHPLPFIHAKDRKLWAAYEARTTRQWEQVLVHTEGLALDEWVVEARLDAFLGLHRYAEAKPLAERRAQKNDVFGWKNLGFVHQMLHESAPAITAYDNALRSSPPDAWTLRERGREHLRLEHYDDARRDLEASLRVEDDAETRQLMQILEVNQADDAAAAP